MSGESKEQAASDVNIAEEAKMVKMIAPAVFLNVLSGAMLFAARSSLAAPMFESSEEVTIFLSKLAGAGAFSEFLVNPLCGKLTDVIGRKPIAPVGNIATVLCRLLMFLNPNSKWPIILEQTVTIPLITVFFTTWRASISDKLSGASYAAANAKIGISAGLAIVLGPMLCKAVMARGHVKYCFLLSACLSALAGINILTTYEETLPPEKRRQLSMSELVRDMQPFSFLQVMRKSPALGKLMMVTGLQTASEGRNVQDTFSIFMLQDLKWDFNQINNFVGAMGIALVVGGIAVKGLMKKLGFFNFTTISNLANVLSHVLYATVNSNFMYLGLVAGIAGGRKRDAVEALIMKAGLEEGFGAGFLSGALMNWRAIMNTIGPLLVGSVYVWGRKRGQPGLVMLMLAGTSLLAELVHQTITGGEVGVDKHGALIQLPNEAEAMFDNMDKNQNGELSKSEFRDYLKEHNTARLMLAGKDNAFHWKDIYAELDADKSGTFSKAEFVAYFNKCKAKAE